MKATFLSASVPLTKTFRMVDGRLDKVGHPRILNYTSHVEEFKDIHELFTLLKSHAAKGHCFLKGNVQRPLKEERRVGATNPNEPTRIMLLDLDGVRGARDVDDFLAQLGLSNVTYVVQYSASMGVDPDKGLSAHIFMVLDQDYIPPTLKQYLVRWNLSVPILRQNVFLTRTYNALRWPLDVSTCQSDKLIYIAPPICKDGVVDGFKGDRIELVKGKSDTVALPQPMPNAETNRKDQDELLNTLRVSKGLEKRKSTQLKIKEGMEYMPKPDRAVVTGVKVDGDFTHLNLNGGDSWGYWHPTNDPTYIRNFKGEPTYLTSELVPDYWVEVRDQVNEARIATDGKMYLAFRDFRTATYYNGIWDPNTKFLDLAVAKSANQLVDFLRQHEQPVGDFVPDWSVKFDPHADYTVDAKAKIVNLFVPSNFMRMKPKRVTVVPPTIKKLLDHALGNDEKVTEHMLNWLAVILQFKRQTGTAWVLHGVQGTGKGLLLNHVLRPIFGFDYVVSKRMEELESQFNGFMERCFILFIDEAQLAEHGRASIMDANFKNYIVEPKISIRRMHTLPYEVDNYLNLIFASNKHNPIVIDQEDRRFNVAVFQNTPLKITDEELRAIEDELYDFYSYLMSRTADRARARTPLNNSAKEKIMRASRPAIDEIADALNKGNLQYFEDALPQGDITSLPVFEQTKAEGYIKLVKMFKEKRPTALLREELQALLEYLVGGIPKSPTKFASFVKHHKMEIVPVKRDGKSVRGIAVKWEEA